MLGVWNLLEAAIIPEWEMAKAAVLVVAIRPV